jgi:hypothetical protein
VMQTARDVDAVFVPTFIDGARRGERRSGNDRRRVVHVGEERVVRRAKTVCQIRAQRRTGSSYGVEVIGSVHEQELVVSCRVDRQNLDVVEIENTERAGQRDSQLDADGRKWVTGTEVIADEPVIPRNTH